MSIRQQSDIFINLLILMLVAGLEELNMKSIKFMQRAFFLGFSDAEAITFFKGKIQEARKSVTQRKFDNLAHLYNGYKKDTKNAKAEVKAKQAMEKKHKI